MSDLARRHASGAWMQGFSAEDEVCIDSENDKSVCSYDIGSHHIPARTRVELMRFDQGDNSWLVRDPTGKHDDAWVFQDCLTLVNPVSDKDVEEAIASIKMSMHPDLIKMLAYEAEAVAQGYTEGDVNHYIQPVIGILRMKLQNGDTPDKEFLEYAVDRMLKACKAETAWLKKMERER